MISRNAWKPESNLSVATILNFDKLKPFIYFGPSCTEFGRNVATFDLQHIYDVEKLLLTGIQQGGGRHLEFRKTDAVSSPLSLIAVTAYKILARKPVTRADERRTEFDQPLMTPRKHGSPSLTRTDGPIERDCCQ